MNPLLFLAIALVVPLLGMVVLGMSARMKHRRVTDDQTEPFRRRLKAIAPKELDDSTGPAAGVTGTFDTTGAAMADSHNPNHAKSKFLFRRGVRLGNDANVPDNAVSQPERSTSVRLIERDYSLPTLPPFGAERDDLTLPNSVVRNRRRRSGT